MLPCCMLPAWPKAAAGAPSQSREVLRTARAPEPQAAAEDVARRWEQPRSAADRFNGGRKHADATLRSGRDSGAQRPWGDTTRPSQGKRGHLKLVRGKGGVHWPRRPSRFSGEHESHPRSWGSPAASFPNVNSGADHVIGAERLRRRKDNQSRRLCKHV